MRRKEEREEPRAKEGGGNFLAASGKKRKTCLRGWRVTSSRPRSNSTRFLEPLMKEEEPKT